MNVDAKLAARGKIRGPSVPLPDAILNRASQNLSSKDRVAEGPLSTPGAVEKERRSAVGRAAASKAVLNWNRTVRRVALMNRMSDKEAEPIARSHFPAALRAYQDALQKNEPERRIATKQAIGNRDSSSETAEAKRDAMRAKENVPVHVNVNEMKRRWEGIVRGIMARKRLNKEGATALAKKNFPATWDAYQRAGGCI